MEMMKERGVHSNDTWDIALAKIIDDARYQIIPFLADRKAAFYELVEILRELEKKDELERLSIARKKFMDLVEEHYSPSLSFRRFSQIVENDERWFSIVSDSEKEDLFENHISSLRRKEKVCFCILDESEWYIILFIYILYFRKEKKKKFLK